jgi:ubiquinone biosynthesis protein
LLTLLFEVTGLFDMRTRPELLLLQKTMVVVEGVARTLDPKLDMWSTAEPVVREWMTRYLGPVGKLGAAAEGVGELGRLAGGLPSLLMRGARLVEHLHHTAHGGVTLSSETIAELTKSEARANRWGMMAQWAIALLLLWIVILLLK